MFFVLSKTVGVLLQPSNLILLIGLAGVALLLARRRRAGLGLVVASVVLLLIAGVSPLGAVMTRILEDRFPPWSPSAEVARGAPDGIVVLGGGLTSVVGRQSDRAGVNADGERVIAIARLARQYPQARIIYAGGDASLTGSRRAEADYLGPLLDDFGVPRARVALETRSRNTAENAAFSKDVANPKPGERWLLVTSAQHMPRAIGCFRQAGFAVEAYPVAWQTGRHLRLTPSLDVSRNLERFDRATSEWIGLVVYWATGRTSALFPSP
ncbi:MAG: YdcF family protein [Pseudolabrys sp.]|jgi:uncharacterized SAM-binding protein YcdF (DUF218 family)